MENRSESQPAVSSTDVSVSPPKVKKPWVKPVLVRETLDKTATTFGPSIFDGSFTS